MKKKDYIYLSIIIGLICCFVLYLYLKGFIFGSEIDWSNQHIVIPEYFRNLFYKTGKLIPSFAPNLGGGQNIYYFSYYGFLSPVILLSYLLPFIPMYIYIPLITIIMLIISVIMMYKWIKSKYDSNIAFIITFIFAFTAPFIYHFHRHIMFVIYMPFLIGALRSVDKYFKEKKPIPLIIYTFLMIMTSYYFSVSGIITIGIYTIYKLIKEKPKMKDFIPLSKVVFYVVVAMLLAGVLLIPTVYALSVGRLTTHSSGAYSFLELLIPKINYKYTFYYSYYSWGVTFIYIISLVNGIINKKKSNIFLSIITGLFILFPICSYLFNGFMYIDGKCFIPFIPVALLVVAEFINNLKNSLINYRRLLFVLTPCIVFMLYCAIGSGNVTLLCIDIILTLLALWLVKKTKKYHFIYIPIIIVSLITFGYSSSNETYIRKDLLKDINSDTYYELSNIQDDSFYRSAVNDYIINNPNKIYNINNLESSIYSSSSNKSYMNFVRNVFQNEVINRDNTTITQTSNVLFNMFMGTKYAIGSSDALIGYNEVNNINGVKLYKNDDVLPIGYASNKIMSLREFETLKYPYNIDALLNYIVVDKSLDNVYKSNVKEYKYAQIVGAENLVYSLENYHYLISAQENNKMTIKLNRDIKDEVLIIKFKMNKQKDGTACSSNVTINGVTNALSCSNWKYHNNNDTFEYVLSSNDVINNLEVTFSNDDFDISDIEMYTMDYTHVKNISNSVDEFVIDKDKSENNKLVGNITVKENGYFHITIPYQVLGFKFYVDGVRVDKVMTDTAFMGFEITKGTHNIEIEFTSPYLKAGIITTVIGLILLASVIFYHKIQDKLDRIKDKVFGYISYLYKIVRIFLIENKSYVFLFLSLFILDISLRIFYNGSVNYYKWYKLVPNMFSIIWILLILNLTRIFKNRVGKSIYLVCYIFSLIMFLVHSVYYSYFNLFFDYSVLAVAGEGTAYYETVLLNIKYWVVIVSIVSVYLTIMGLRNIKQDSKVNVTRLLIVLGAFALLKMGLPMALGSKKENVEWDDWRNPRSVYSTFNDNNKSMMVSGMFEYNIRNFYISFVKDNTALTEQEQSVLNDNFSEEVINNTNNYSGIMKGKNIMFVQLESIDDFLVTKDVMPTLYNLTNNSINFKNHYSFTNGGGSTFNSEFMVNTGYSSAYNYNMSAYSFSRNAYPDSMPNIFKELGYSINAFHMNTSEYYSRGVNYKAFGYDNYYGLKDMEMYNDNTAYWLDTELLKNETFNEKMFSNDPFISYVITYSAHMPYKTTSGTCAMLTEEEGLTEYECLKIQARETDDFLKLLIQNLKQKNLMDNTVLVIYSDHYIYTLEDSTLLDKYKTTSNNLINHTPFIIYDNGKTVKTVKSVNSQLDILPTVLNLFGISYNVNNYIGRDILDNNYDPIVFFNDGSWYNGSTYVANGEYSSGYRISNEKLEKYNSIIKRRMLLNDAILKSDYFNKN